jgi:DUF1680 family protein
VGSSTRNEGFTQDYSLPNKSAYCETCASIGMVFWNNRMNLLSADARYADVAERVMYNAVLAGISLSGDRFFYVNPLEADGNHHRQRWFGTACCPSNLSRFLPAVGDYMYMVRGNELFVNLYAGSEAKMNLGETPVLLSQKTDYPWSGNIAVRVDPQSPVDGTIKLRIPEWCKSYSVKVNGKPAGRKELESGYFSITRNWKKNDHITLYLDMPAEVVAADPLVKDDAGKRAVQRGPIVYCIEKADNPDVDLGAWSLSGKNKFKVINSKGILAGTKSLETAYGKNKITFIPYYAWDNRAPGKMLVWIDYKNE